MNDVKQASADAEDPNQQFYDKAERTLRELFERAKAAQELHFVMALMPEFRGMQDAGWNTAEEAIHAYDQYTELITKLISKDDIIRVRVILAFYMHVAEGSGFYEMPKKMLLTVQGCGNNIYPFHPLVKRYEKDRPRDRPQRQPDHERPDGSCLRTWVDRIVRGLQGCVRS